MFQTNVAEKIKTHLVFNNAFFENRTLYECTWKDTVELDRPQMTIEHGACAFHDVYLRLHTHTQTHTLRKCNYYCFYNETTVKRKHLNFNTIRTWPVLLSTGVTPEVVVDCRNM
jgi:hypothetical protein